MTDDRHRSAEIAAVDDGRDAGIHCRRDMTDRVMTIGLARWRQGAMIASLRLTQRHDPLDGETPADGGIGEADHEHKKPL